MPEDNNMTKNAEKIAFFHIHIHTLKLCLNLQNVIDFKFKI